MTGSLQIKQEKYYIVLNCTEQGKRKQKWISTGLTVKGNKRKAEQMLREKLAEYEKFTPTESSKVLFADYVRHWLTVVERRVDEVTFQGYELIAKSQVLPYFDESRIKLKDVTTKVLQVYFDDRIKKGRRDGKGNLSAESLRRYKNVINQTLNEAVKNGLILSNPCQFVELPKSEHREPTFYNADELKELFTAIKGDPLAPVIQIAALYGLRRSEVLGLKWDSIDFEANRLTIKHTVSKVTKAVEKDKTKNKASHRSFALTAEVRKWLQAAKDAELNNRRICGAAYIRNDYVFKWPDGNPFTPDYVTKHFAKLLKKHNLPKIRFHDLRHSCASMLLSQGFTLKDVQEYLGHADIKMTANIYGHLDTARKNLLTENIASSIF